MHSQNWFCQCQCSVPEISEGKNYFQWSWEIMYMKVTFLWRQGRFCKIKEEFLSSNFSSVLKSRVFIYNMEVGEIGREKGRRVVSEIIRDRKRGRERGRNWGWIGREIIQIRIKWFYLIHTATFAVKAVFSINLLEVSLVTYY